MSVQETAEPEPRLDAPPAAPEGAAVQTSATGFSSYLFVHAAWFLTNGMQGVFFPYLVRIVLKGSEAQLGIAQMCLTLPATFLVLIGGVIADRVDVRRQIMRLYAFATLPYLAVAALLITHTFNYTLMILYAVSVGTVAAFTLPSRDALLARMAPNPEAGGIQRAVSLAALAQFSGQIVGNVAIAAGSRFLGVVPLLLVPALVMGTGAFIAQRLRPRPAPAKRDRSAGQHPVAFAFGELAAGMKAVRDSPIIGALTLINFGVGATLVGSMQVLMPLMVQSYFSAHLTAAEQPQVASALAIFTLFFWIGTILVALGLVKIGMPKRKGRAYLLAVLIGGVLLLVETTDVSFPVFCGLNFLWGIANGVIITIGRGVVQELAPEHLRARILSVFSFGFMLGGPVGAVSLGFLAGAVGPHNAMILPGLIAILIGIVGALTTPLWRMAPTARIVDVPAPTL